jgi:insulysin
MRFLSVLLCAFLPLSLLADPYEEVADQANLPILTPALAARQTAKIVLQNGLRVYLLSDPDTQQSAAALAVEAGCWQDPKEYPGMAHFLEHMLFMGTEAYPEENAYAQYILDHGGRMNAFTASDRTLYAFSVHNDAFPGALDRFSHFFIDPLLSPSCIARELHAVDQEHAKNIENDAWRAYMIFKETGNPLHPNAQFSTGNAHTLGGIPQEALRSWYETHYSADRMHLALISPLPLDALKLLVVRHFAAIERRSASGALPTGPMTSPAQLGHLIYVKPVKEIKHLSLVWEVPATYAEERKKSAADLVAYALTRGGTRTLLEQLKREQLAEDLSVAADHFSRQQALFRIDIALTEQGVAAKDTVVLRVFQAIERLRASPPEPSLFHEMQQLAQLHYQYPSREEAFDFITDTACAMIDEDLATFPLYTHVPAEYDPSFAAAFLSLLTPESCLFVLTAPPSMAATPLCVREKWMGAEYAVQEIPEATRCSWEKPALHPQIDYPPANPFVPERLALLPPQEESWPRLIVDGPLGKLYYAQDARYQVPECAIFLGFRTPKIDGSATASVLCDLYIKALDDALASTLESAASAGLGSSFFYKHGTFTLAVQGFHDKAHTLTRTLLEGLTHLRPSCEQFDLYKESLLSRYANASHDLPLMQGKELLTSMVYRDTPTAQEKRKALQPLSYEEFLAFAGTLFSTAYLEGLVYGNLSQEDASALWKTVRELLPYQPFPEKEHLKKHVLVLPDKQGPYMVVQRTERQGNAALLLLEEGPFSFAKRAAQQVLGKALEEAFFHHLRTRQQTAYIAQSWDMEAERQLFQFFAVQSNTHHPRDLIARFELFLEDFNKHLEENIPPERFDTLRAMLIATLAMPPENLQAMATRLYALAFEYAGAFDWYEQRIKSLEQLSYADLVRDAHAFLSRANPRRLAVLIEGTLPRENDFHYEQVSREDICGIGTYTPAR